MTGAKHPLLDAWNRVVNLENRYRETGAEEDLEAILPAIRDIAERKDVADLPADFREEMGLTVGGRGEAFIQRHLEARHPRDLERGLDLYEKAAGLIPDSSPWKIRCLLRIPGCYAMRFKQTGDVSYLRRGAQWAEQALAAAPDDPARAQALFDIGVNLSEQFELSADVAMLETAVDRFTEALTCSDPQQPHRKLIIAGLGKSLIRLTLNVRDASQAGERWRKAIDSVPFRSLDQQDLSAAWHHAFEQRAEVDHPQPVPPPTFVNMNRTRLRAYAPFNDAANGCAAEMQEVRSFTELEKAIEALEAKFAGALLVFRGQTDFRDGRLSPSMARKSAREDERLLWIAALEENLRYGGPDPAAAIERQLKEAMGIDPGPSDPCAQFWQEIDVAGPAGQAVLQHYGARTHFIDVSTSLEVALWFAHFSFRMRRDLFERKELTARAGTWGKDDPLPEYDSAWYEPAWSDKSESHGYLFVVAPRVPESSGGLVHGEYIDLSPCPSARMRAQHAGLVYFDLKGGELARTVARFKFRLPLEGAPAEVLDGAVERLFPSPKDDPLYARILWCLPFSAEPERPDVLVRRLHVPEYHAAPAERPRGKNWGDGWGVFRGLDSYVKPALAYPHLLKDQSLGACHVHGKRFLLADAVPVMSSFPSMAIQAPIPADGARLNLAGRHQVFLEYDPLSSSLSPRAASHHFTGQIDRHGNPRQSMVPFPGVRGAWVVQMGELYWCRVFRADHERLVGTAGRAFGYNRQFGWVVKVGASTDTSEAAVEMRAERAALYLVLGLAEWVEQGAWRLSEVPGSRYLRLSITP